MRRRKSLKFLIVFAVVAMLAAGCGDDDEGGSGGSPSGTEDGTTTTEAAPDRGNVDGTLKFGAIMPESGALANIVSALRTPIDMAIAEINEGGGVLGKDVELAVGDDGSDDPALASNAFDRLAESEQMDVLLGPAGSDQVLSLFEKIAPAQLPTCSGSSTSYGLTEAQTAGEDGEGGGYFFRTAPPDTLQGPALADLVASEDNTSVAIIVRNDSYGTGFAQALEDRFETSGVDVATTVEFDPEGTDFTADAQAIADAGADAVIMISYQDDGGKVLSALTAAGAGPDDVNFYGADGIKDPKFFEKVDAEDATQVEGIRGTAPASAPAGVEHPFIDEYAATGEPTIFSSYFYDCTMIAALAAEAAQSDAGADIIAEVPNVVSGGEQCSTWADCKALLDDGQDIDYEGASGSVDLNDLLEVTTGVYDVWEFDAEGADNTEGPEAQITIREEDL
jgi:branched-chain amino acid transport system substrate-binding protein